MAFVIRMRPKVSANLMSHKHKPIRLDILPTKLAIIKANNVTNSEPHIKLSTQPNDLINQHKLVRNITHHQTIKNRNLQTAN